MPKWTLITPPTFMHELIGLPQQVSRLVTQKVKVLERDPISAQGDAKKAVLRRLCSNRSTCSRMPMILIATLRVSLRHF